MNGWSRDLDEFVSITQSRTSAILKRIKKSLERSGLQCDQKFRQYFLQAVTNRLTETFDRFEIDTIAVTERSNHVPAHDLSEILRKEINEQEKERGNEEEVKGKEEEGKGEEGKEEEEEEEEIRLHNETEIAQGSEVWEKTINNHNNVIVIGSSSEDEEIDTNISDSSIKRKLSENEENAGKRLKSAIDTDAEDGEIASSQTFENVLFNCAHCHDTDISTENSCSVNIEIVYAHWLASHSTKPFKFYVCESAWCSHCLFVDAFTELKKHHSAEHPNEPFVIINRINLSKCGVCTFSSGDLVEHFHDEHQDLHELDCFGPICLSKEILKQLLAIDVHKKRQCIRCSEIFLTPDAMRIHHQSQHCNLEILYDEYPVKRRRYVICNYCQSEVRNSKYFRHIKSHQYEFECLKCDFRTNELIQLTIHDKKMHHEDSLTFNCEQLLTELKEDYMKSKFVFGNGLVLTKQSLLGTKYDDLTDFEQFIEKMIENEKKKYFKLIQSNDVTDLSPISSSEDEQSSFSSCESKTNYSAQLSAQNQLGNNVCVVGVPWLEHENLYKICRKICLQFDVKIEDKDIISACRASSLIIVQFKDIQTKIDLMKASNVKEVFSNEIIDLPSNMQPEYIYVNHHMTAFFTHINALVRKAKRDGIIHSFRLTQNGFFIRQTEKSEERIVSSAKDILLIK